jgi:hypothetical protein
MPPAAMPAALLLFGTRRIANIILTQPGYPRCRSFNLGGGMDNIQKLVFGVIGIAGLATFLASGLPSAPLPAQQAIVAPQPETLNPAPPPSDVAVEGENPEDTAEEDGEDVLAMGEPVIDGQPYGTRAQSQANPEAPQMDYGQQMANPYYGQMPQQNYAPQPNYMPPQQQQMPQPGTYVPPADAMLIQ